MRTRSDKRPSHKHDRKVLKAEESTKSWVDTDSESSSSSSSSSDSEQEEVHCLMADQTSDDEVFDFSNIEFTREDLVQALNDMVHEYKTLSHTFEEIKAENASLKNSSAESSSDELEDTDSLTTELSKLRIENELLRSESSELKAEVEKLTKEMSSWTQLARAFHKLQEIQKSAHDRTGLGFSNSESSEGETSTQSQPVYEKFNKMSFVKADVIYDCFESVTYDDQNSPKLSDNGKDGIGFSKPERSKPNWPKNKLDKDKAKAGQKPFVPNQPWRSSKKVKTGWKNTQPRRDLYGQHMKSKLNRSHCNYAQTLKDTYTGKTVKELAKDTDEAAVKPTDEVDLTIEQWLDDFVSRNSEPEIVGTRTITEAAGSKSPVVVKDMNRAVSSMFTNEEHMSIDDLLLQISDDMLLPSITATDITKIRLADFLKSFTEGLLTDSFVEYFCDLNVQSDLEIDSDFEESYSNAPTVYRSPSPSLQEADSFALGPAILSGVAQEEQLYYVQSPVSPPTISLHQESSSSSTDVSMHFNSEDISLNARTDTQPSAPVDFTVFTDALEDLRLSMSQRIHDYNYEILSKINSVEIGVREALLKQNDLIRQSLQNSRRDHETQGFTQVMHINDLKKGMLAQVGPVFQDLMDIKRSQREKDAKITALDRQVAAIRNEQLDFQKIAADLLSLSTQFGDIVDYIRGGDAKKGEGSSSRPLHSLPGSSSRPLQPPPADQIRDSGHVASLEELEEAAQRFREADRRERERDRQIRERRLSRSGAFKRRRGF
ncbi:hypothetical protein F511_40731 [Dorcoceras hygrometricum]|uniref:Uncharacterized protein n=1 Tax=Dorcoceras hygrometricum TaxID=472368 RepID=A0A2Z7D4Z7_9LAMI|nr:hypothetical protein F511_40731 [Dorcoceras hygrometricum]